MMALGLCLLAFMFAVEAKTALYIPADGPGSVIRAAKALPAEMPVVVSHGAPESGFPHTSLPLLAVVAIFCVGTAGAVQQRALSVGQVRVSAAAYFSPVHFFRPPPSL
jgi:hypothetical protein